MSAGAGVTSVGSILGGAFGVVRRNPLAVLVWGVLYVAAIGLLFVAMRPIFAVYSEIFSQALARGGKQPLTPEDLRPYMDRAQSAGAIAFLAEIGIFSFLMVLVSASQRAVLRPLDRGFAYLRVGGDELRLIGLGIFLMVCLGIGMFLAMLAGLIVVGITLAIAAAVGASPAFVGLLLLAQYCLLMGATIYAQVRLSLAFPLTFLRRTFVVGEAWRLSNGRFWTLFGAYFLIALIYMALALVLMGFALAPFFSEVAANPSSPDAFHLALQHQAERFSTLDATNAGLLLGFVLLAGFSIALFGGAMATAVRDLVGDEMGAPTTFA